MVRLHSGSAFLALMFAVASACGGEAVGSDADTMSETLSALNAAVSDCKTQRDACETAQGAASASCDDQFRACHGKAVDKAMPDLKDGAHACAAEARTCREAAADSEAKRACSEELKQCVSEVDHGKAHADGGAGRTKDDSHGNGAAVRLCIATLHGCMDTDTDPNVCTAALRACLDACIENQGQGRGHTDAGKPVKDDAQGKADAPHGKDADGGVDSAACHAERTACLDAGKSPMECAQAAKTCRTR
jgi:hypothetical protein